jgi:N-carbamoyl-L-amino-acid hydrolase
VPIDAARTVRELRELHDLTGDAHGAQRVCWTPTWQRAREWLADKLATLPVDVEIDEAGNQWATLPGDRPAALVIGSHLDSVADGGWLDGALGVVAGLEVLRRLAEQGRPPVTVRLVSWADEEGSRFGRSLLGSSAAAGDLHVEDVRRLSDRAGIPLPDALRACGVDVERMGESSRQLESAAAYLELHIEQGPVLERLGLPLGAVIGTCGVERHAVRFTGQAAHAGSTPMEARRDAFAAAARLALAVRGPARRHGGVATVGQVAVRPGIPTAVAGHCEIVLDQRHLDASALATMLAEARAASEEIAAGERVAVAWEPIWRIDPLRFDPRLVAICERAVNDVAGQSLRLPSGPLHDAAEVAKAGVPAAMVFVQSLRGLSHASEEDTRREHLELAVEALDRAADLVIKDLRVSLTN